MPETVPALPAPVDLAAHAASPPAGGPRRVSSMAAGLVGSEILRIAAEIRALQAAGRRVADFTVGDFSSRYFPIPDGLAEGVRDAISAGHTNYPPSNGIPELREAVRRTYARDLGLAYPVESVLVAGGSRPLIYAMFRALCDPGDRVVFPVPSWNNNHYAHLVGAAPVPVACPAGQSFLPTARQLAPLLRDARLLCLNTPLNPAGTVLEEEALAGICDAVLDENARRARDAERPLFVMYDQVYRALVFDGRTHHVPPALRPEMARYTVFVDGISKSFAATGLRVGWGVGPADVMARMSSLLGHVGAWAPRAEQVATASFLEQTAAVDEYLRSFRAALARRLAVLRDGFARLRDEGLPADVVVAGGALYQAARLHPFGATTPAGAVLRTNDDVRRYLLEAAGVAIVPFQAFGCPDDDGWFRLSVGAVAEEEIGPAVERIGSALRALDGSPKSKVQSRK